MLKSRIEMNQTLIAFPFVFQAENDAAIQAKTPEDIKVTLPDGKEVEAQTWRTTPYDIACGISKGLADSCVVAKVRPAVTIIILLLSSLNSQ